MNKLTPKQQAGLDKLLDFERQYQEEQAKKGLPSTVPNPARFKTPSTEKKKS